MPDFSNPFAPVDYGRLHHFFTKRTVANANFATNCDEIIKIPTTCVTFQLESGTTVQYSFNGIDIMGDMTLNKPSANLIFTGRAISKMWFKGDGYVRIEAW